MNKIPFNFLTLLSVFFASILFLELYVIIQSFSIIYYSTDYKHVCDNLRISFSGSFLTDQIERNYISEEHFHFVKTHFYSLIFGVVLLVSGAILILKNTFKSIPDKNASTTLSIQIEDIKVITPIFLIWLLSKILWYHYVPVHVDEMFDYTFYAKSSLIARHAYIFTESTLWSNNHMFYSDLTGFLYSMGFSDKIALRLPSILGEFLLIGFLYFRFRNESKMFFGMLVLGILSSYWANIYSVEGRSYYLFAVCSILSFFVSLELYKNPTRQLFLSFVILSIIGFALSRLFLLPFLGLNLFQLFHLKSKSEILIWLKTNGLIFCMLLIFYIPALLLSGTRAIYTKIDDQYVFTLKVYPMIFESLSMITNIESKSYIFIIITTGIFLLFYKKTTVLSRKIGLYVGCLFLASICFTILIGNYLPGRTFIFLNLAFLILLISLLWDFFKTKKGILITSLLIVLLNFFFNLKYSWLTTTPRFLLDKEYYSDIETTCAKIRELPINEICVLQNENSSLVYLKYHVGDSKNIKVVSEKSEAKFLVTETEVPNSTFEEVKLNTSSDLKLYRRK